MLLLIFGAILSRLCFRLFQYTSVWHSVCSVVITCIMRQQTLGWLVRLWPLHVHFDLWPRGNAKDAIDIMAPSAPMPDKKERCNIANAKELKHYCDDTIEQVRGYLAGTR